jgi:hypothetical protein
VQTAVLELQNYYTEMATVIPFAVERFATDHAGMTQCGPQHSPEAGFDSSRGRSYLVGDKPMTLPVRVGEASQGWALYFVPLDWAQRRIAEREDQFTALDTGRGRTPLVIFAIDHRESDMGSYQELGVALLVRPRSSPRDLPGLLFLSLIVGEQFTIDATRTIWGYRKGLAPNMDVRYRDGSVTFCVDPADSTTLSVSFPRFGSGRSSRVPCYIYSVPDHASDGVAHRTILSRSSSGEGVQYGGQVDVRLSAGPNCVCRSTLGVDALCICAMLRELPLPERPAANGWAQFVSGAFGPAIPCV